MRELYMTDTEIERNFRAAVDKKAQVGILAELNAVDKSVIHNKLLALGLIDGEPMPEKSKGGRPKMAEIDEAEARKLIEKDVPDEQIAKHFGVGITTFRTWRREKGIMRYQAKKRARKTVEEVQKMSVPILGVKQREEKPTMAEKLIEQLPADALEKNVQNLLHVAAIPKENEETPVEAVKIAQDAAGMTVEQMASLFTNALKLGRTARVTVGGKPVRAAVVNLRFNGSSGDPTDMSMELEV